jgi:hypothetical protein
MPSPRIDRAVHARYEQSKTVRQVVQRLNPTVEKKTSSYVEAHGITYHRIRKIDAEVELEAPDSKAPEIIGHHIHNGVRGARAHASKWDFVIANLGPGNTAYRHTTGWIETLDARILPAMYCAKLEIDLSGIYEQEYLKLRTEFINECQDIHITYKSLGVSRSKKLKSEEKLKYKIVLENFVICLEEWELRALRDLAPSYSKDF